jgi:hypothetical protein
VGGTHGVADLAGSIHPDQLATLPTPRSHDVEERAVLRDAHRHGFRRHQRGGSLDAAPRSVVRHRPKSGSPPSEVQELAGRHHVAAKSSLEIAGTELPLSVEDGQAAAASRP